MQNTLCLSAVLPTNSDFISNCEFYFNLVEKQKMALVGSVPTASKVHAHLQVSQLYGGRRLGHDVGSLPEGSTGLLLPFGRNHLE